MIQRSLGHVAVSRKQFLW